MADRNAPPAPALGMITFVDTKKTRRKRDPGRCYLRAGFKNCGMTKGGLVALQLLPEDMPNPARPLDDNRGQASLFEFAASGLTRVRPLLEIPPYAIPHAAASASDGRD